MSESTGQTQNDGPAPAKRVFRIFISYGHDEHTSLAARLHDDLVVHGHRVWFDERKLQPGHDWEAFIEEGLNQLAADKTNAVVLLLLTPHSVRRPDGYCLNEVAWALGRGLRIIPLMVVDSEPPLSICRIQWLDMRPCIPIHEKDALYQPRFEQLLQAIEENKLDFEGVQQKLLNVLKPIEFSADIFKLLRDFTGRRWVFDEVDAWLKNPNDSKIFLLTGAPGAGKSAIAAWIRENRREIAAFHFCDINSEEKRDPARLVRSVAYQLSTQLPEYQDRLGRLNLESIIQESHEAYTLFDQLVIQPMANGFPQPDRTVVVLIDALDEATYQRQNDIVKFLSLCAAKTQPWLRFLVTSRPEPGIVGSFRGLAPHVLDTSREENRRDLRAFLQAQLPGISSVQMDTILARSEGVFLYVRHVVDAIRAGQLSLDRPEEFPRGLGDVYQQFFARQFGRDLDYYEAKITPLLQPVLTALEPLNLGLLKRLCAIDSDTELGRRLNRLGSLFPVSGEGDGATIRPFHRSLCDWITDRTGAGDYYLAVADGHKALAECGWREYAQRPETMDDYFLNWLPTHLQILGDDRRLTQILKDFRYLMERTRRGMLDRLLADFRQLPARLTAAREGLEIEAAFFRQRAHILRRGNANWPVQKTLLQLAIEHADDSPLTAGAEGWLIAGRCDWLWLRRVPRLPHTQKNPCLAVLEGHTREVAGVLALADGRILSWSYGKALRLWDGSSGACLAVLEGHTRRVNGGLALPNGQLLSWADDYTLRLWDGTSGACLGVLEGHTHRVSGALALEDGWLLSWSGDKTLRLWDRTTGACLAVLEGHTDRVNGALALEDGWLLSWSGDKTLRLWDRTSGACLAVLEGHTGPVYGALALPNGRLLSWSEDKTLRLWDRTNGTCLAVLEGHTHPVYDALAMPNGRLFSWSLDNTLRVWDGTSGACLVALEGHLEQVRGALALQDGRLLSWSTDGTLRQWDLTTGTCLAVLEGHTRSVRGALALPGTRLLSWSDDGTLRFWDGTLGTSLGVLEGHAGGVAGALALSDGRLLSWSGRTLRLWDGTGEASPVALEGHTRPVYGALALPNGRLLSWSEDKTLRLWDGTSGACLAVLQGHTDGIKRALALPNGRLLSRSRDNTLRLWDGTRGACLAVLEGHTGCIQGASALADGRLLSWSDDKTLRLWDGTSGVCLAVLEGHTDGVRGALVLANGRLLSWSWDKTLRLWDGTSGACLAVLEGHTDFVGGALALADGRLLSWDNTLRLWDGGSGACLAVIEGHTEGVYGASALSDGRLLSWSLDNTLRVWDGTSGACLAVFEGHAGVVNGALPLPGGRLLSWSWDETLRLWDGVSGACLEVSTENEAPRRCPQWLHARAELERPQSVCRAFFLDDSARCTLLGNKGLASVLVAWHAESDSEAYCLFPDGTAVITQANGQVCILKLHHGNKRVSLDDAERLLAIPPNPPQQ